MPTYIIYADINHLSTLNNKYNLCSQRSSMSALNMHGIIYNICWPRSSMSTLNMFTYIDNLCWYRSTKPRLNKSSLLADKDITHIQIYVSSRTLTLTKVAIQSKGGGGGGGPPFGKNSQKIPGFFWKSHQSHKKQKERNEKRFETWIWRTIQ